MLSELLYADDIVLMSEIMDGFRNKFRKWLDAFESKGLKVIDGGDITKHGFPKSKVDPCGVFNLAVKTNSILCVQCCTMWPGRCDGVKMVTTNLSRKFCLPII